MDKTSKDCSTLAYEWLNVPFGRQMFDNEQLIEKAELIKNLLIEEVDEFIEGVKNKDEKEIINACSDLLYVANNLPYFAGISLKELQEENKKVFTSNMSKFCKTFDEAQLSQDLYKLGLHPNKRGEVIVVDIKPSYNEVYPYYLVTPEGKVMKSHNFEDVN